MISRGLFLATLLFAGPFLSASWAQNKAEPGPPYPNGSNITRSLLVELRNANEADIVIFQVGTH